jgi:hypothetical protein
VSRSTSGTLCCYPSYAANTTHLEEEKPMPRLSIHAPGGRIDIYPTDAATLVRIRQLIDRGFTERGGLWLNLEGDLPGLHDVAYWIPAVVPLSFDSDSPIGEGLPEVEHGLGQEHLR